MRDRMRDRSRLSATAGGWIRDRAGGSCWVCSVTTTRPGDGPIRVGDDTAGWYRTAGNARKKGEVDGEPDPRLLAGQGGGVE